MNNPSPELTMPQPNEAPSSPEDEAKNLAHLILSSPAIKKSLQHILNGATPPARDYKEIGTYYKKEYALQLKPFLDQMIDNKENVLFKMVHFPDMKETTLWSRINQSFRFLVDQLDTSDKRYATLRTLTKVKLRSIKSGYAIEDSGVIICYTKDEIALTKNSELIGTFVSPNDSGKEELKSTVIPSNEWKNEVADFLDNAPSGSKQKWILNLTEQEVSEWQEHIKPLEEAKMIDGIITRTFIWLIKI